MKNKNNYSKEFKDFILALQNWVEQGCPERDPFRKADSICFQIKNLHPYGSVGDAFFKVKHDLKRALEESFGGNDTPFNQETSYSSELCDPLWGHYKNEERLAWIKMMADTFKAEENK